MSTLPAKWRFARLEDVCEVNPREPGPPTQSAKVSFVPMPAVSDIDGIILPHRDKPFSEVAKGYTRFREGDVIFAKITPCMENGKIAIARGLIGGIACGSTEFHVLRCNGALLPGYLWRFLRQPVFRQEAERSMTGAVGQRRVPAQFLKQTGIPLPPPEEQRRIVTKLEKLLLRSKTAREELTRVPRLIERYKQAILTAGFQGALSVTWRAVNSRGMDDWREASVNDIADVGTGATPKRGNPRFYAGGKTPWITSSAVNDAIILSAEQMITEAALLETNCKVFPPGTLLIAMYGEGQTRGKVSVLGIHAATNQALAAISVRDPASVSQQFLFWFLRANYLELRRQAAGGVQPNLNLGMIKATKLLLPQIEEQNEIVRRIELLFQHADAIVKDVDRASDLLDRLDEATLAKAFRGELVDSQQLVEAGRSGNGRRTK